MKKAEFIERYGKEAWEKWREQTRVWMLLNKDAYYAKKMKDITTGLQGARQKIRVSHGNKYRQYKNIIAPDSQLHHEWIPKTAEYRGVALVEADQHMYGIIDVIQIVDGKITLLTEKEIKEAC